MHLRHAYKISFVNLEISPQKKLTTNTKNMTILCLDHDY